MGVGVGVVVVAVRSGGDERTWHCLVTHRRALSAFPFLGLGANLNNRHSHGSIAFSTQPSMFPNMQNMEAYRSTFNHVDRDQINADQFIMNQNSGGSVQIANKISNVYGSSELEGEKQKRIFEPSHL